MRRYSKAVKADMRRQMSPPQRQSFARLAQELGICVMNLDSRQQPPGSLNVQFPIADAFA